MITPDSHDGQPGFSIRVSVPDQTLELLDPQGRVAVRYPVSTSKFGLGMEPGSQRTPLGRFTVEKKIGDGAPPWSVFVGREPTGEIASPGGEHDGVLTRILWLSGAEPVNANTLERYIYIHGTNREDLIGTPASHGCVRMRNHDVIDLYERVPAGTTVEIVV
jgi:lipoprotein-anchoring transpeptidase ErfK/SrfK